MIYSLRFKLFMVFVTLLVTFSSIFLIINAYFIDDIFAWGNKRAMSNIYSEYKAMADKGYTDQELISELNADFEGNIAIIDPNMNTITSTYTHISAVRLARILPNISQVVKSTTNKKGTFFFISSQNSIRMRSIVFIGKLSGGKLFVVEKPFGTVYESSKFAEGFIIISGIGTLIIGSILVFFLSGRLVKPIVSINNVAKEIANLNFEEKVKVSTNDEIGTLAKSINLISDKLSTTLGELQAANDKLRADIAKERSMEKMRRRFVSSVSHELKTPISLIQGYADGLKFNIAKDPEDMKYYCNVIIDESEKMSCLIKDLLDLSSYESGTFTITKSEFDFADLVRSIAEKHKKPLLERNIGLEIEAPEQCIIDADRLRLEQVISNFVSNAERYVQADGSISLKLEERADAAYLSIFNSGSHIEASEMDNIWTSFYKIESKRADFNTGTGLGLAIVKAIVELHGGSYGVENTGEGVRFWIEIPVK